MRVLFPFIGDSVGGSHVSAVDLILRLAEAKIEPKVLLHRAGPLVDYLRARGVSFDLLRDLPHVRGQSGLKLLRATLACAPTLASTLRRLDATVVHTNDKRIHLTWIPAARLARRRSLVHLRLLGPQLQLEEPVRRLVTAAGNAFACVSQVACDSLPPSLARRTTVLHDPLDWDRPRPDRSVAHVALCCELGLTDRTIILGMFGRLSARKRPSMLIDVAATLRGIASGRPTAALFVGDDEGELQPAMVKAQELGIASDVRHLAFRSDVAALMSGCDVILAPALREAFGRTLLEGCSVGTPVLAAAAAGHQEIFGVAAPELLMPVNNASAFAARALDLVAAPDTARARMAEIRRDLSRQFGISPYLKAIRSLYCGEPVIRADA